MTGLLGAIKGGRDIFSKQKFHGKIAINTNVIHMQKTKQLTKGLCTNHCLQTPNKLRG